MTKGHFKCHIWGKWWMVKGISRSNEACPNRCILVTKGHIKCHITQQNAEGVEQLHFDGIRKLKSVCKWPLKLKGLFPGTG